MLRSFHYASVAALFRHRDQGAAPGELDEREGWISFWYRWVTVAFLKGYLEAAGDAAFLPGTAEGRQLLLDFYLLEKALYELGYEAGNRPGWMRISLHPACLHPARRCARGWHPCRASRRSCRRRTCRSDWCR